MLTRRCEQTLGELGRKPVMHKECASRDTMALGVDRPDAMAIILRRRVEDDLELLLKVSDCFGFIRLDRLDGRFVAPGMSHGRRPLWACLRHTLAKQLRHRCRSSASYAVISAELAIFAAAPVDAPICRRSIELRLTNDTGSNAAKGFATTLGYRASAVITVLRTFARWHPLSPPAPRRSPCRRSVLHRAIARPAACHAHYP